MATIAQGVLGPMAGWLMLLFIMVTLYDAQFPFYDTFIGRTTCDAIAVTTDWEDAAPVPLLLLRRGDRGRARRLLPDHGGPAVHPLDRRGDLGPGVPVHRGLADPG